MCFYAQTAFSCGDWKWGNMMERCPRQHRIGETCGAKLVHPDHIVDRSGDLCKICQEIEVKRRRLQKLQDNIMRWEPQGNTFAASLEKAKNERSEMLQKMRDLNARRASVMFRGNSAEVPAPSGPSFSYGGSGENYADNNQNGDGSGGGGSSQSGRYNSNSPYSLRR